jgi:FkbM family methyltransferase
MSFISYAQNYEDVILWRALRHVENGFYVDVGAADPKKDSVTWAFYERRWSGINVEPLDEYFDKLTQARPRDTNLKVAVGREAGLRTLHAINGTGLSTFDHEIAVRHQAAGWQAHEVVVPVLTLAKILEDCAAPMIHFLKIDVEGAEAEVLEGLDLDRVRPWIILVEATLPNSTAIARDKWEHLVTDHKYSFAYFDGLNCFYVADEVAELKQRLTVPPNVFDEFVRFPDWANEQTVETLQADTRKLEETLQTEQAHTRKLDEAFHAEQARSANLHDALQTEQAHTASLHSACRAEQQQTANLRIALQTEQHHTASLHDALRVERAHAAGLLGALHTEQVHTANFRDALRSELALANQLLGHIRQLELKLAAHRQGPLTRLREAGDRITGGGLRALTKRTLKKTVRTAMSNRFLKALGNGALRPFPTLSTRLYRLATAPEDVVTLADSIPAEGDSVVLGATPSPDQSLASDGAIPAILPASAQHIYLRLRSAMSDTDARRRNQ